MALYTRIRRGKATNFTFVNPILGADQIGFEHDTGKFKYGDGTTRYNDLTYAASGGNFYPNAYLDAVGEGYSGTQEEWNVEINSNMSAFGAGEIAEAETVQRIIGNPVFQEFLGGRPQFAPHPTGDEDVDTAAVINFINSTEPGDSLHFHRGTYVFDQTPTMLPDREYNGTGAMGAFGTQFKMADGANLNAVFAAEQWLSGNGQAYDAPVLVRGIYFNANSENQTSGDGHGFVDMNFYSRIIECKAGHTRGDGFRRSYATQSGLFPASAVLTNCPQSKWEHCMTVAIGGVGFHSFDTVAGYLPDGYVLYCEPSECQAQGILITNAKGWMIHGNHPYANKGSAIKAGRGYMTRVTDNYCEGYGSSTTAGIYCGIDMSSSAIQGGSIVVTGNVGWANSDVADGSTCRGVAVTCDNSVTAENVTVSNNAFTGRLDTISTSGLLLNCNNSASVFIVSATGNAFHGWATNLHIGTLGTIKIACGETNDGRVIADETFATSMTIRTAKAAINCGWGVILTGNLATLVIEDGLDGQTITLFIAQDATGGRTFAWPASVVGGPTIGSAANEVTVVNLKYRASTDKWYKAA